MSFTLLKSQYDILISLANMSNFISSYHEEKDSVQFYVDDISGFQDEFYFNIVENGMDREGDVNKYGQQLYNIYDAILAQI